jgi:hypothetical protein
MKYKTIVILIALLAMGLASVYAGNTRRIGTAGAQELRIPVGSRGTAMGGAVIADVYGVESIFWNPAGLAGLVGTEAMFSHQPYLADIDINFVGVGTAIEDFGTIAAAVKVVSIGTMEETTREFPDGTGREFSPALTVLSLTYAKELTARVSFGFTGMLINEQIFEVRASGVALDVGFIYRPGWQGVSMGLAIKNYGPEMRFEGEGFYSVQEGADRQTAAEALKFELPSSFNFGLAYDFLDKDANFAKLTGNFMSNNYSQDVFQGGFEYTYDGKYSIRAGYNYADQDSWLYGFSAGAGIVLNLGETDVTFEYTWTETDVFDANQYFTGKINF